MNRVFVFILVVVFLVACGTTAPKPSEAVLNGVTRLDRSAGLAELSVSALDENGDLFTSGRINDVSATVDQTDVSVTGGVCEATGGQISSRGALTSILTLDASGSMSSNDPQRLRADAAKDFVERMDEQDRAAISSFTSSSNVPLWQDLTSDKSLLSTAIDRATSSSGGTNLWGAAIASIDFLAQAEGVNKVAVLFTDGVDTQRRASISQVIASANENDVKVFMIGLGNEGSINVSDMTSVASGTLGFYSNVSDNTQLGALFNKTLNAAKADGCIDLTFDPAPPAGETVSGDLTFSVNGESFTSEYAVTF